MSTFLTLETLRDANRLISDWIGVSISDDRLKELEKVLKDAMVALDFEDEKEMLERLQFVMPDVASFLVPRLTIPETYFFRDNEVFHGLEATMLPDRLKKTQKMAGGEVVIWSAACSSGEEAYSIAAVCKSVDPLSQRIRVLASDINPANIARAKKGKYKLWSFREKLPPHLEQFFVVEEYNETLVAPPLRDFVNFFELNLLDVHYPPPLDQPGSVDILFCRNALMYFSDKARQKLVDRFVGLLKLGGYLVVASCELSSTCHPQLEPVRFEGFHGLKKVRQTSDSSSKCLLLLGQEASAEPCDPMSGPQPVQVSGSCSHPELPRNVSLPKQTSSHEQVNGSRPPDAVEQRQLAEAMFIQSIELLEAGDKKEALAGLRKTLYLDSAFVMAHVHLGFLVNGYAGRRHLERAISLLEKMPADAMVPFGDNTSVETVLEALCDKVSRAGATQAEPHYSELVP